MDEKKEKRVLSIELDENVKKVSITGLGDDETVVMKQELSEEELDLATGGGSIANPGNTRGSECNEIACRDVNNKGWLGTHCDFLCSMDCHYHNCRAYSGASRG